jgi:hypothetical protein
MYDDVRRRRWHPILLLLLLPLIGTLVSSSTTGTLPLSGACRSSTGTSSCGSRSAWPALGSCTASRGGRNDSSVQRSRVRHRCRDVRIVTVLGFLAARWQRAPSLHSID